MDLRQLTPHLPAFPLTHHTLVTGAFFLLFSHAGPWNIHTVHSIWISFPSFLLLFKPALKCHLLETAWPSILHSVTYLSSWHNPLPFSCSQPSIPTVLHPQIQPATDPKYSGKKSQKVPKHLNWPHTGNYLHSSRFVLGVVSGDDLKYMGECASVPCILCKELARPWALVSMEDPGASHLQMPRGD